MARSPVATDDFATEIGAAWDIGPGDWANLVRVGAGVLQPTDVAQDGMIVRNTGTYSADQYSKITNINLSAANANFAIAAVRCAGGTDEACYIGHVGTDTGYHRYAIFRVDNSYGFTLLWGSGANGGAVAANSTLILEVEGDEIRLITDEGSGEVLRGSVTDSTLTSGRPGMGAFTASLGANAQVGPWEGGDITSGGGGGGNRRRRFLMAA